MDGPASQRGEKWSASLLTLILAMAAAFRLTDLDGLAPFIDESADLVLTLDYQSWSVWDRLLHGKLLGYLWFKPILLLAWDPLYAARLFSAFIGLISVILTYRLLSALTGTKAALAGTAFFAFMPLGVFHDRLALFDGVMVACVTAAVFFYFCHTDDQPLALLLTGFLFGTGALTKAYALLAVLLWLPVLRRRTFSWRSLLIVAVGFLVCLLVMGLFLAVELREGVENLEEALKAPNRFLALELSALQRAGLALDQLGQIFGYLNGYNGWVFLPVVLLAALAPGDRRRFRLELLGTWLLSCIILSVAFQFLFSRYLLMTLPAVALLVALAVDDCLKRIRTQRRWTGNTWFTLAVLWLLALCGADVVYRDTLIAAQLPERVLPARDAYQYLWGGPSGFGLREIADRLRKLDLSDERKVICVTRGMGTGTHGAATLLLLLRHEPIRFVHLWLRSEDDIQLVRSLPARSLVVFFVEEPDFLTDQTLSRLGGQLKLLLEVRGTSGRPDYRLFQLVR
ncbi:MAG: ArnT family glycosyltransferase [Acidobacteriota bacterium]